MDFDLYIVTLRLLHILTGVFWAGTIFYLAIFIGPAVKAIPEGGKFMQQLANTNRLPIVMMITVSVNIIAGYLLMYKMSGGFSSAWMGSTFGITLSIGATTATIAYIIGLAVNMPTSKKIAALGQQIAASGASPTPENMKQLVALRDKIMSATNVIAWLLVITVITMATARYL